MARQMTDIRGMQRNQLQRINKEELIDIILASNDERGNLEDITKKLSEVMNELDTLKRLVTSPDNATNKKISALEAKLEKQEEIIAQHQRFMESLDRKERENNVVVLGVPDERQALDGATQDDAKLTKVWDAMGVGAVDGTYRRLGRGGGDRCRPILFTLRDKNQRPTILDHAKNLKELGEPFKKIFVKKDVHPSVRKEWQRLRDVEKTERERPENVGCVIRLDPLERKVYKDGCVIDSWKPQTF